MSDLVQGGTALSRVEHGGDQRSDDGAADPDHPKEFYVGARKVTRKILSTKGVVVSGCRGRERLPV